MLHLHFIFPHIYLPLYEFNYLLPFQYYFSCYVKNNNNF